MSLPTLFLSHGAPSLLTDEVPARQFLLGLGASLPRPRAILCISAHWLTGRPMIENSLKPDTIHDFGGFAPSLYEVMYPSPGDPTLAAQIVTRLRDAGMDAVGAARGLDHGVWVPLKLMYPKADIPVIALSLQPRLGAPHHWKMGEALRGLAQDGVLIVGSGSATHNLSELGPGNGAPTWVMAFDDWLCERAVAGDGAALTAYRAKGPHSANNHPSDDHYLPLLVAMAAAGAGAKGTVMHRSTTSRVLRMTMLRFDPPAA